MIRLLLLLLGVWVGGMFWYAARIPAVPSSYTAPTDAIIVLTGGSKRLAHGFHLIREQRAKELLITGVGEGVSLAQLLSEQHDDALKKALDARVISLDYSAISTTTNATSAEAWMKSKGFTSARLVTANYHMPRAMLEFSAVMPEVQLIPEPVFPEKEFHLEGWYEDPVSAKLLALEFVKYLAALLRLNQNPAT